MFLEQKPVGVRRFETKGRGLYAVSPIRAGELIESAPVLIFSNPERRILENTRVAHYYFHWEESETDGEDSWSAALALGRISLCNHASPANARFVLVKEDERIDLFAAHDIDVDEEITIDYDCPLWFQPSNANAQSE
ncbi:SET domain-containing protein [Azospirillaceae bacterium]